jgi:hypothetical protein
MMWAQLRKGVAADFQKLGIYEYLEKESTDPEYWITVSTELWSRGRGSHHITDATLLHMVVRNVTLSPEDKVRVLWHVLSFKINPSVLCHGYAAVHYCKSHEKEVRRMLESYQKYKPYNKPVWKRIKTFLLVEKRNKWGLNRDLKNLMLQYIGDTECVRDLTISPPRKIFRRLKGSPDADSWITDSTELWQRGKGCDPMTDETILHLAVKCTKLSPESKIKVVNHILTFEINPYVPDNAGKRAIDYCKKEEKKLYDLLADYQTWKPEKKVMDWYGPYCRERMFAFLLVEKRLKLGMIRDIRHRILSYVAEREYLWMPMKK